MLLLWGTEKIWEYCVFDDTMEEARAVMYDFYRQDKIDNLFLGSSHVYFDIHPQVMDACTGEANFNLSTPFQPLIASYYLLREADRRYEIKNVYLEMFYGVSVMDSDILYNWRVYDYMPLSFNKLEYVLAAGDAEDIYLGFFKARRTWQNVFEPGKVAEIVKKKRGEDYQNHRWVKINENGTEYFVPGGFLYTEYRPDVDMHEMAKEPVPFADSPMAAEPERYLRKILDYCKERDINIILFSSPVAETELSKKTGHDRYREKVEGIAGQYGRAYYDFSLCREEFLDLSDDGLWRDPHHLNVWGAQTFTEAFYRMLLAGQGTDPKMYFYESYAQKAREAEGWQIE